MAPSESAPAWWPSVSLLRIPIPREAPAAPRKWEEAQALRLYLPLNLFPSAQSPGDSSHHFPSLTS